MWLVGVGVGVGVKVRVGVAGGCECGCGGLNYCKCKLQISPLLSAFPRIHLSFCLDHPGNTKGGSITIPLTSCLTGLESAG